MIVYFGQFFENYQSSLYSWATFPHSSGYVISLTKNGLGNILCHFSQTHLVTLIKGYIFGEFLTSSSGHPG
jgi:hypothetical protein